MNEQIQALEAQIKDLEGKRDALIAQSEQSEDPAELETINKQLATINESLTVLRNALEALNAEQDADDAADVDDADDVTDERTKRVKVYQKRKAADAAQKRTTQPPKYVPGKGFIPADERVDKSLYSAFELRAKAGNDLKENRAVKSPLSVFGELRSVTVTPASGETASIVVPSSYTQTIAPTFPVVSSLIDAVDHLSLDGGNSLRTAFITDIDAGDYTDEGANAAEAETHFSYVDIIRTKITAYAEISKELEKLPSAPYADVVFQNIRNSMRKLLTKEILIGAGGTNQIVGIFSDMATAIDAATDYPISQITDTTLDEILFRYGGDEEVEDPAVLILNKLDLLAFSKVRTSTKQKFYDIQLSGNGGTISGVPFIINSACKSLMTATDKGGAAVGDYCMAYGNLSAYQLVEFSPMEVERSDDYQFRKGMRAFLGEAYFGGQVVRKNGFLRITKASS